MQMKLGQRRNCKNPECGREVIVARTSSTVMKEPNVRPMAKELTPVAGEGPPLMIFRTTSRYTDG